MGLQGQYRAMVTSEDADRQQSLLLKISIFGFLLEMQLSAVGGAVFRISCVGTCSSTVERLGQTAGLCPSHTRQFVNVPAKIPPLLFKCICCSLGLVLLAYPNVEMLTSHSSGLLEP